MSPSMIERVINAIRDSFNSNDVDCSLIAKAAIKAMREPTREMCFEACNSEHEDDLNGMKETWQTMIEAALQK